jgi:D-galactarolactone cycloisomerase
MMRLARVETIVVPASGRSIVLLKVTSRTGLTGFGEADTRRAPGVVCDLVKTVLAPALLEIDYEPTREGIGACWDRMYDLMRTEGQTGGFFLEAIAAVDIALWDLAGQAWGMGIAQLVGDEHGRAEVPAFETGLRALDATGLTKARKMCPGFQKVELLHDGSIAATLELFDRLKENLADGVKIGVNARWSLNRSNAIEFGRQLDSRNALWLANPLLPEDALAHRELREAIRTPIAIGENYHTRYELAPFFNEGALDVVTPDIGRSGITESLRIAQLAAHHGVDVAFRTGATVGPQLAAAIQLSAGHRLFSVVEHKRNQAKLPYSQPIEAHGGNYFVPRGPGLGLTIDERELSGSNFEASRVA